MPTDSDASRAAGAGEPRSSSKRRLIGLFAGLGVLVAFLISPPPADMNPAAWHVAGVVGLMGVWWVTEATHISVTGLVPLVLFPLLDVLDAHEVAATYADHIIFLFFGAFFLAIAMEKWHLHRRVALLILLNIGRSPRLLILGFLVTTALLSMWVSNTASTIIMLPIALAVIGHAAAHGYDTTRGFGVALMLGLAYSASIGGLGTPVGTPPNVVFLGAFTRLFPEAPSPSFFQWMSFGVPTAAVMVGCVWLYLVYGYRRVTSDGWQDDRTYLAHQLHDLGPLRGPERRVCLLSLATALLWIFRKDIQAGAVFLPGWSSLFPHPQHIQDSTVAMLAAILLFLIPSGRKKGEGLLTWDDTAKIPWGILVLLGGSLALAEGVGHSGLADWAGAQLGFLRGVSPFVAICAVCALMIWMTEFTSNTATTTLVMPVLAATAGALEVDPLLLMLPATFAASCAFMLPTATAPNAIIFASGHVSLPQMFLAGIGLNVLGIGVLTAMLYLIGVPVFDISLAGPPDWAVP